MKRNSFVERCQLYVTYIEFIEKSKLNHANENERERKLDDIAVGDVSEEFNFTSTAVISRGFGDVLTSRSPATSQFRQMWIYNTIKKKLKLLGEPGDVHTFMNTGQLNCPIYFWISVQLESSTSFSLQEWFADDASFSTEL